MLKDRIDHLECGWHFEDDQQMRTVLLAAGVVFKCPEFNSRIVGVQKRIFKEVFLVLGGDKGQDRGAAVLSSGEDDLAELVRLGQHTSKCHLYQQYTLLSMAHHQLYSKL